MLNRVRLSVADYDIRRTIQNGSAQGWNFFPRILIVAVRIDDNVGTEIKTSVYAGSKCTRQAAPYLVTNDIIDPRLPGDLGRPVCASIINDQDPDFIKPFNGAWNVRNGLPQGPFFVETRNLDDELHSQRAFLADLSGNIVIGMGFIELEQSGVIDAGTGLRKQRLGYHDGAAIEETV